MLLRVKSAFSYILIFLKVSSSLKLKNRNSVILGFLSTGILSIKNFNTQILNTQILNTQILNTQVS
jgi:hypothetical protein